MGTHFGVGTQNEPKRKNKNRSEVLSGCGNPSIQNAASHGESGRRTRTKSVVQKLSPKIVNCDPMRSGSAGEVPLIRKLGPGIQSTLTRLKVKVVHF